MNSAEWNEHSNSIEMIQAALLSSFPLQMAVSSKKKGNGEAIEWVTGPKMIDRIELSPSSLLSKTAAASSNVISPSTVILYSDRVKVGNKAVATAGLASPLSPVCLVLFSSHISVNYEESPTSATINGWLKVHLSARQAAIMKLFRSVYEHHQGNDKKHWAELSELLSDILKPRAFK